MVGVWLMATSKLMTQPKLTHVKGTQYQTNIHKYAWGGGGGEGREHSMQKLLYCILGYIHVLIFMEPPEILFVFLNFVTLSSHADENM